MQPDRPTEHLATAHLVGSVTQRFVSSCQVCFVDADPPAVALDERGCLLGEFSDLGGGQLDVVEEHRPSHVRQLGSGGRGLAIQRCESEARPGSATRSRHLHLEARVEEDATTDRHDLPCLFLGEDRFAPPLGARPGEFGHEPLGAHQVVHEPGPDLRLGVRRDRPLDGLQHVVGVATQYLQVPRAAVAGRIEPHHQRLAWRLGDRLRPLVEEPNECPTEVHGSSEGRAVETAQIGLGEVGGRTRMWWGSRGLDLACCLHADGVHGRHQGGVSR